MYRLRLLQISLYGDCYRSTAFGIVKTAAKKLSVCKNSDQYVRL
jgi:hypothetical protein